ncbi:K(+)-transporting ATPase subunit F [Paenibacillus algorifonticola]
MMWALEGVVVLLFFYLVYALVKPEKF